MEIQDHFWNLLVKRDQGIASAKELQELAALLTTHPELCGVIKALDLYWKQSRNSPESEADRSATAGHWLVAEMKLGHNVSDRAINAGTENADEADDINNKRLQQRRRLRRLRPFTRVDVMITALICLGVAVYYVAWFMSGSGNQNIVRTTKGSKTEVTLPDGSRVYLNSSSELRYPDNFKNADIREVTIAGEAYFHVKHDSSHPFVIHTSYLDIKDLGTVFNVKAYPNEPAEATLISGAIEVNIKDRPEPPIRLRPKEKVVYKQGGLTGTALIRRGVFSPSVGTQSGALQVMPIDEVMDSDGQLISSETAWTRDQFVFKSATFAALAPRMQRWFGVPFSFKSPAVRDYVFTGIFEEETLDQALRELQLSRDFIYRITNDSVTISGRDSSRVRSKNISSGISNYTKRDTTKAEADSHTDG